MFTIVENPEFSHAVKVMVPVDGGHAEQNFVARFKVLPAEDEDKFEVGTKKGLTEFLRAAVVSLDELVDAQDNPIPYNTAVRDKVLGLSYARLALLKTYMSAVSKVKSGN